MATHDVVLCSPVRTAIGAYNGSLKTIPAPELGAAVVRETLKRSGLDAAAIGSVVLGNVIQAGNKENMDRAPYLMDGGRWGYRMGPAEIHDSMLRDGLDDAFSGKHSGWHTEDLVTRAQLTREAQDRFAERSQRRFGAAQKAGKFADEIVSVEVRGKKGVEAFAVDEAPRPDTTIEVLAKLRPAFRESGTITAGSAPSLNSAAAAMIVADRAFAETRSIEPMARLASYGVAAVGKALERAGWKLGDVERIEINEAFAAVPLAVAQELSLPEDIINVEGGAIAHGHPIGATGAVL